MDANYLQARAASAHMDASSLNWLAERSAPKYTCTTDKTGHRVCKKQASFFHRVGKFILIAVLIFFAIITLLCLCCCLKMRKSKSKNVDNGGAAPQKKGLFGMFGGKKNQEQQYNLETAQPNGFYGQQPPQAHLAGQEGGQKLIHPTKPSPPSTHLAAIQHSKGTPLVVSPRPTPTPSAHEILIRVYSIALNPVDNHQLNLGLFIASYPAIVGSDVSGVVTAVGTSVKHFQPGDRVTAFAPAFDKQGEPDYGAFQEFVVVPAAYAAKIPQGMGSSEGARLPMAVQTVMAGFYSIGLPRGIQIDKGEKGNKGIIVWGGSSSVGSAAVQIAKLMGLVVFATASTRHHAYIETLGASRVFEYKDPDVVEKIVKVAREDGVTINYAFDAAGAAEEINRILTQAKEPGINAKFASAIPVNERTPRVEGVNLAFVAATIKEPERTEWSTWVFHAWLEEKLANGEFVPSPKMEVLSGGLDGVQAGLDRLKQGVSATKLVLEIN